jgi:hypothetical protein
MKKQIAEMRVSYGPMARKPTGVGRGGARRGAGRPKGSKNKRVVLAEALPKLAEADQQLPLYRLLDRIADEQPDPKYRDLLCISVLPFLHPKPRSDLTAKAPHQMTTEELYAVRQAEEEHQRQLLRGKPALKLIKSRQ